MAGRGSMNKDVSIRYTGDDKDFKKAAARVNTTLRKQAAQIESQNTQMEGSYKKATGAAAAMVAVFAVSAIAGFLKKSIEIAKAHGELSDRALETSINMTKMRDTVDNIKSKIGGVILESKLWHFWAEKLKNTFIKIDNLLTKEDAGGMKILGWSKTGLANMLKSIDTFADKIKKAEAAAIKAAKEFEKLKKENHEWAISLITRGKMLSASTFETPVKGVGMARGGATLAGPPEESINNVTAAMEAQSNMVNSLSAVFENMFLNIDKGFKGMIESLIEGIKKLVIELTAKAAVLMLIRTLFPMSFGVGATTQLMGMFGSKLFSGNLNHNTGSLSGMGSQSLNIGGEFVLRGADAYALVQRHSNVIGRGT